MNVSSIDDARRARYVGLAVLVVAFVLYIFTLCPTVSWDDSGELIVAASSLGVSHPPGQCLHAIVGRLFTSLPVGPIAWRVNLLSAIFGALTVWLVFLLAIDDAPRPNKTALGAAVIAAAALACAPAFWGEAVITETTTLHAFFMMLTCYLLRRWGGGEASCLPLAAYIFGVSLTNHPAGIFLLPVFFLLILDGGLRRALRPRVLAATAGLFLLGLATLIYIPIASTRDPLIDWGDPEGPVNLLRFLSAAQYRGAMASGVPWSLLRESWYRPFLALGGEFAPGLTLLAAAGLVVPSGGRRWLRGGFALTFVILAGVTMRGAFVSAYMVPVYCLASLLVARGTRAALEALRRVTSRPVAGAVIVGLTVVVALHAHEGFSRSNRRGQYYAEAYGREMLGHLDEGALLLTGSSEATFISWYLTLVEGYRDDVAVVARPLLAGSPGYRGLLAARYPQVRLPAVASPETASARDEWRLGRETVALNAGRAVFWEQLEPDRSLDGSLRPWGLCLRVDVDGDARQLDPIEAAARVGMVTPGFAVWRRNGEVLAGALRDSARLHLRRGELEPADDILRVCAGLADEAPTWTALGELDIARGRLAEAERRLRRSIEAAPRYEVAYGHLLALLRHRGDFSEHPALCRRLLDLNPRNVVGYFELGCYWTHAGRPDLAVDAHERAREIAPGLVVNRLRLAEAYTDTGDFRRARDELDAVLDAVDDEVMLVGIARIWAAEGQAARAGEALAGALLLDPALREVAERDRFLAPLLKEID